MTVVTTSKLDKKSRNALGDDMFAFPRTRACPLNDAHHTKLAWGMVDGVKNVSAGERTEARQRILARAAELNVPTKDWHKVKSMHIECMALNISSDDDHPNKMPFTGVLTKVDEMSDAAPGGSGQRKIIVSSAAAEAALGSLLGMAVDFTSSFDGHDPTNKIGLITSADVVGNEVRIGGFIYAADFPETADLIQKLKDDLGFSFEAQRISVEDPSASILRITELTFTGAAILMKDKAAYTTTSLAASADNGDFAMTKEELEAILAAAIKPLTDELAQVKKDQAAVVTTINANAQTRALVEPHAAALEATAAAMEAAGVGAHTSRGHVMALRKMADGMRAEAAVGNIPAVLRDYDYGYYAGADRRVSAAADETKELEKLVASAVEAVTKPLNEELASLKTQLADAKGVKRLEAGAPERKTLSPASSALLSKIDLTMPDQGKTLNVGTVDKLLAQAGIALPQRIMLKTELTRAGVLA